MKSPGLAITFFAAACAAASGPIAAQYANEFIPAKLIHEGTTAKPIAGSGTVIVQVQVNANGTHKAIKVIKSTNSGDNGAALDIAQNSTYRPAHRGKSPVTSFYDFTLKFNGNSVASSGGSSAGSAGTAAGLSPAAGQVADLIRAGKYAQAVSQAQAGLLSAPGDESLRQMLGIAAFDNGDFTTAAAAFDKVSSIGKKFVPIAAQSFAAAAAKSAESDPALALDYAKKAAALQPSTNSNYALGVAQLASKQYDDAIATLKAANATAASDPKTPTKAKVAIQTALMEAYLQTNDTKDMQAAAAAVKQLDPTSTLPARVLGNSYLKMGTDAATAKNYDQAFKYFDQAASQGDSDVAVTADVEAAFMIAKMDKPDYKQMQSYADKALALKPDDAQANFAEGISLAGQWVQSHDDGTKQKSLDALNKADQEAKTAGNGALALQIESFIKGTFKQGSTGSGS